MKKILTIITVLLLLSCKRVEKRGYSFELSNYRSIKEVINNKDDVLKFMGNPSFISTTSDEGGNYHKDLWVYYSEDLERLVFLRPKVINRKIITISFEKNNRVEFIKNYNLKNNKYIIFNESYTKIPNTSKGWINRVFSNIGQIKAN